ncbi:MAG: uncharacterized protein QG614_154 [Patescibacteria group bacterium]|nr:uncharacterized protein [Patescibacteria group bacterium]
MQEQIKAAMKAAMIAKEMDKLQVIRSISAAFTNEMVSEARIASGKTAQDPLSDEECLKVIKKLVKQRKDSIEQFVNGGREDLAETEKYELSVLETFLPAQLTREQLTEAVKAEIAKLGEIDPNKKPQTIGQIIKALSSNADGKDIKEVAEELLK